MNPEFVRNVWLELTPVRRWALPLVFALLIVLIQATSQHDGLFTPRWSQLATLGFSVFVFFALWGCLRVATSVTNEVMAGTWDQQRLAPHRPWSLLVGKLFGAPIFDWYAMAMGGGLFFVARLYLVPPLQVVIDLYTMIVAVVLLHATALFSSLAAGTAMRGVRRPMMQGASQGMAIVLVTFALMILVPLVQAYDAARKADAEHVQWWFSMPLTIFVPLSLTMFLGWALLGAHRQLRAELQEPVGPGPWIGFLVFLTLYLYPLGAVQLEGALPAMATLSALVWGTWVYPLLLVEQTDVVRVRSLMAAAERKDMRALWIGTPLWAITFAGFVCSVLAMAVGVALMGSKPAVLALGFALAVGLHMLRDIPWILVIYLNRAGHRQPQMVVAFFLGLLYLLLPMVLGAFEAKEALFLLLPGLPLMPGLDGGPPGSLAALAWAIPGLLVSWTFTAVWLRKPR